MTSTAVTDLVRTSGARLHTEKTGQGPALVLIPGGGGDAEMYGDIVPPLAKRFTVITLDRRGNSRSPLDDESNSIEVADQAADVLTVLDHYGIDRAFVFGNSGSAIITLELLAEHAGRLLGAVVHEPPLVQILPGSAEQRELDELRRIGDAEGPLQAFVAFAAMTMPTPPRPLQTRPGRVVLAAMTRVMLAAGWMSGRVTGREPSGMQRLLGNAGILIRRELPAFCYDYEPSLAKLRSVRVPWRLATGQDSVGRPYYRPAHVLSEKLDVPCVEFPGGHTAYQQHPEAFADRLTEILDQLHP
ncbi:alpha/beta fold hydrolase [Amycolatopsis taiwanensis]|uniref:Hydrolase n=1 Tax=Amycolatopsis taiwanensis TaxID=342230 RepID=A0A9W6R0C3_9PSEU|nr:alpha/beta hydrolase [Amycolatopsis taiwanensis]GLY65998.1 hydrolase [Amycolatopsis taiwanensis]